MKVVRAASEPADPLDLIAGQADGFAQPPPGGPAGPGPDEPARPELASNAQCVAMGLQIIRETLCAVAQVQSPRQTLNDATVQIVADALAPVLDKHGIQLASVAGDFMLELRAAAVIVPILLAANAALREELAFKRARPINPDPAPAAEQKANVP